MKRFTLALVLAISAICGMTTSTRVSAQEILIEGPLAGAPAVRKMVQYRKFRFSIGPQFAYTILNHYMHNFLVGARLEFNLTDWLGVGAVGYFGINVPTKLTNHITDSTNLGGEATTPATTASNWPSYTGAANFEDQVAKLKGQYLGQLSFVPFRGKMSMFEKLFVAIDGAIFAGGGIVHYEQRAACDGSKNPQTGEIEDGCGDFTAFLGNGDVGELAPKLETEIGGAFTWGVNFMAYFNNWFAINIEYRMTPFKWNAAGTDEAGNAASQWQYAEDPDNDGEPIWISDPSGSGDYPDGKIGDEDKEWSFNQSIGLGLIFYFPFDPRIGE
ncbi:MAG: hypothetical protein QNJ97_18205 [Myxococcota bacterium]|nr:hypothetical protein [Myxococcota bacterium]